jgi:1-acyl-sn-glycerol-3-phosphate acyltransferase
VTPEPTLRSNTASPPVEGGDSFLPDDRACPPDPFGLDRDFIERRSRGIFHFLCRRYWRIETRGLEHVPRQGPAILLGAHRGFVPFDAMMALHIIRRSTGRIPRFLVHPGLLRFSAIARIISGLGGVIARRSNAERLLGACDMLGVFPEGVAGAFSPLRDAYRLREFGHDAFVRLSARYQAPIIPFVTLGSAEVFPIFANIHSRRWKRFAKWPSIPISTFPFALPVKWHMQFLPPVVAGPSELKQADVTRFAAEVRARMQSALDEMLQRRRRLFWGEIFEEE